MYGLGRLEFAWKRKSRGKEQGHGLNLWMSEKSRGMGDAMIELIGTIVTVIALAGAWLNNRHKVSGFYLWIVSNLLTAGIHAYLGLWSLMIRDLAFLVLAIEGIRKWSKQRLFEKDYPRDFDGWSKRNMEILERRLRQDGEDVWNKGFVDPSKCGPK
jgi:hypothetical protein